MAPDPDDDVQLEYHSRQEALRLAHSEALRAFEEHENLIRYVAYLPEFHDFCLCEFVAHEDGWLKTFRALVPSERLAGEEIRDEVILELATVGNMVAAIRLYRSKHGVGLKEAFAAIMLMV